MRDTVRLALFTPSAVFIALFRGCNCLPVSQAAPSRTRHLLARSCTLRRIRAARKLNVSSCDRSDVKFHIVRCERGIVASHVSPRIDSPHIRGSRIVAARVRRARHLAICGRNLHREEHSLAASRWKIAREVRSEFPGSDGSNEQLRARSRRDER